METIEANHRRTGASLSTDIAMRYAKRVPTPAYDDLGSPTPYQTSSKPTRGVAKSNGSKGATKGKNAASADNHAIDVSDDEMDLLAQASEERGARPPQAKGRVQPIPPTHIETESIIKKMRFKRKSDAATGETLKSSSQSSETPSSSNASSSKAHVSSNILSKLHGNENRVPSNKGSNPYNGRLTSSRPSNKREDTVKTRQLQAFPMSPVSRSRSTSPEPRNKGKEKAGRLPSLGSIPVAEGTSKAEASRATSREFMPAKRRNPSRAGNVSRVESDDDEVQEVTMKRRKSPIVSVRRRAIIDEDDATPRQIVRPKKSRSKEVIPEMEPSIVIDDSDDGDRGKRSRTPPRKPQAFPVVLSPVGSPSTPMRSKKGKEKAETDFPMLSPLHTQEDKASFPFVSPLSSPVFGNPKVSNPVKVSKSLSSMYEDTNNDGNIGVTLFKPSASADSLDVDSMYLNDDSLFADSTVDPSTLCPYCDEPLPPSPTPHLQSLLAAAKRKSYREPRPGNPQGLKAPLPIFITVCQRHQFEALEMPKAKRRGWPTSIDFGKVRQRVEKLAPRLRDLVSGERGRKESVFWNHVMKEVQAMGSRAAAGVKGQFDNFNKTQPGYYGELGSMVIHQTIYNLFPPSSFDADSIAPLTPAEFIQRILVPEAALALIMEDMGFNRDQAATTMRESAAYGVAMFPDTGDGDGKGLGVGVGEDIVRERARARRKELEVEERVEEKMLKEAEKQTVRPRPRMIKKRQIDEESATETESAVEGKGKAKRKKLSSDSDDQGNGRTSRSSAATAVVEPKTKAAIGKGKPPSVNTRVTRRSASVQLASEDDSHPAVTTSRREKKPLSASSDDDVQIVAPPQAQAEAQPSRPRPRPRPVNRSTLSTVNVDPSTEETPKPRKAPKSSWEEPGDDPTSSMSTLAPLELARQRNANDKILDQPDTSKGDHWLEDMEKPLNASSGDEVEARTSPLSRKLRRKNSDSWLLSQTSSSSSS